MFELTVDADYCVNVESLSERMRISLVGAGFQDKIFIQLVYNFWHSIGLLIMCLFSCFLRC